MRDPAGDRAPVGLVWLPEPGAQPRFLVADDEQVERHRERAGIHEEIHREEQPCLAADDEQGGDVDRVPDPAVGAAGAGKAP